MEGEIILVTEAIRQASRFLLRDFYELEHLQSSMSRSSIRYAEKSRLKTAENIKIKLDKYFDAVFFNYKELISSNFTGKAALVDPINGFNNFTRSIPFFANFVSIFVSKNNETKVQKAIMNFPALGEIYYTERGKGVWLERHNANIPGKTRLRASNIDDIERAVLSVNSEFIAAGDYAKDLRILNCDCYSLACFIAGKIDIMIFDEKANSSQGIKLFIEEAGASYYSGNGLVHAANLKLLEKIKTIKR